MSPLRRSPAPLGILAAVLLGAASTAVLFAAPGLVAVRALLSLPYLLLAQGYVLVCALFGPRGLGGPERLTAAVVASLADIIIAALGLHVASVPITPHALSLVALGVTVVAAPVALMRMRDREPRARPSLRFGLAWAVAVAAAVVVAGGLIALVARPEPNPRVVGYTALWSLRTSSGAIRIGVRNAEQGAHAYRVVAVAASGHTDTLNLRLAAGTATTTVITLPGPSLQRIAVTLYRDQGVTPYRQVTLNP